MKKHTSYLLLISLLIFLVSASFSYAQDAETVTVTTYYPSPFGEYMQVRFTPSANIPACTASNAGVMLYNQAASALQYCDGTQWRSAGGGSQYWALTGNNLVPVSTGYSVTIGTQPTESANMGSVVVANKNIISSVIVDPTSNYTRFDAPGGYNYIRGNTRIYGNTGAAVRVGPASTDEKLYIEGNATVTQHLLVNMLQPLYRSIVGGEVQIGAGNTIAGAGNLNMQPGAYMHLMPNGGNVYIGGGGGPGYLCLSDGCRNTWPAVSSNTFCMAIANKAGARLGDCSGGTDTDWYNQQIHNFSDLDLQLTIR